MKRFSFIMIALMMGVMAWADAPAGYAIYGDVPAGFTNLTGSVNVGQWGGGVDQNSPTILYTGKGQDGTICNGNYLSLSLSSAQTMNLTEGCMVHIIMRKTNASANDVHVSFCQGTYDKRAGFVVSNLGTEFKDVVLTYSARNTQGWNSYGTMFDSQNFAAGQIFRFSAVNGEQIEIKQVYITAVTAQSKNLGILRVKNMPMYSESSAFVPNGGSSSANVNLYLVSMGDKVYAKMTKVAHEFNSGFSDHYQLRTWKANETANQTLNPITKTNVEVTYSSNALFGIGETALGYVSVRADMFFAGQCCSTLYPFRGTYVNTPTGDLTAPTASAEKSYDEETGKYSVTITGSDDSGDVFYYVENVTKSSKQVSMVPTFEVIGEEGDHVQCYVVDFDGNMSAPVELVLQVPACDNCFKITL